jgi:GNAT superfamily N-acetyltransferase
MFAYLAERDGTARGLVHIILHRSGWLDHPTCYLQDLFVDPGERGTGMGHALIEHVYDVIRAAGGKKVYWLTHESNATARQLYDRVATNAGFIQYVKSL